MDEFLAEYPALLQVVELIDRFLQKRHPSFFGQKASHPFFPIKPTKVFHDNLWGTNQYSWRECILIDSPLMQRLRDIHQVGLSFQIYPSARHTRFEHCLGVATIASRIFDALISRHRDTIRDILQVVESKEPICIIPSLKQELRLAALLHDTGHSLFSHSSEQVYQNLSLLKAASEELTKIVGKEKGAGEVLSFCITLTKSVALLLERAKDKLIGELPEDDPKEISMTRIALMIVGRGSHPFLQFLGDIISSGFDADKLDYLLRDATSAGLPLRYDLDRYLYFSSIEKDILSDGKGELEKLYKSIGAKNVHRHQPRGYDPFPYYESYRLRFPKESVSMIEQVVICKLMLYSYIYHHRKIRAAEGILVKILERMVNTCFVRGEKDEQILERFLEMTDSALYHPNFIESDDEFVKDYSYRLVNRLLPREVYRIGGALASHAERALLTTFLDKLQYKDKKREVIAELEQSIGKEIMRLNSSLGSTPELVLAKAGVWVDVPKPPVFEDIDKIVIGGVQNIYGIPLKQVFPIDKWTQAYTHFRYYVRIFAFSEYWEITERAAKSAMKSIIGIKSDSFYERAKRIREYSKS